jgi:hypothetical protein
MADPVAVEEFAGISPRFAGKPGEMTGTRILKIAWSDYGNYYKELFPVGLLPATCPNESSLYADNVEIEPFFDEDVPTGVTLPNAYNFAKVTVHYKQVPYEDDGTNIITRRWTVGGQFLTMPNTGFQLEKAGGGWEDIRNPDLKAGKIIGTIDHEITIHQAASVPWVSIRSMVGCVNNAAFEGAAQETLLLQGVEITQVVASDGTKPYQITYKFQERNVNGSSSVTWNHIFDPSYDQGKWRRIRQRDENPLYALADFSLLF